MAEGEVRQPVAIQFSLDRPIDASAAPFLMAAASGSFGSEGLAVNTNIATGTSDAISRVAAGSSDFALVDINALIRFRDRPSAPPIKAVFVLFNQSPYAIVARKNRGIHALSDIEGKNLGVAEGDLSIRLWPALARQNGIKIARVKQNSISAAVREPMLSAGQVDAVTGFSYLSGVNLRDRGVPADDLAVFRFADYGCEAYGVAVIVNPAFAAAKPEAVKGFLRAVIAGTHLAIKEPGRAADEVVSRMDDGSRDLELERLRTVIHDNILTGEVKRNGIGGIDPARLERSIDQIAEDFKFQKRASAADIFDETSANAVSPRRSLIRMRSCTMLPPADPEPHGMSLFRIYARVLELLGKEARLGWILAGANLLLAGAQFAEPVLFGRIVDVLSGNPSTGPLASSSAWPLLAAWAAFGLFTIGCSAAVALHADRLAHRQRQAVLTNYFEHIMQLPLTFHTGTHSGRLMKVMLNGTDALWRLWLGFFREHFAAIISLLVLLPLALYINWRLAILLFALCVVFTVLTTLVVRKTYGMQSEVEAHYSDLSARASDALGNVALVQSFVRIDAEVQGLRFVADKLLAVQIGGSDAGAVVVGAGHRHHPGVDHHHRAGDLHRRHRAARSGPHHRRRDRDVREFRHHADPETRTSGQLHQQRVHGSAAAAGILQRAGCRARGPRPARRDRHRAALGPGRIQRRLVFI